MDINEKFPLAKISKGVVTDEIRMNYTDSFKLYGVAVTRDLLLETWPHDLKFEFNIVLGRYTPCGFCRDCGDHYIVARFSRYDRLDKETLEYTFDVEDK